MDTFCGVVRYKHDGCIVYFIVLIGWESILIEICARLFLEAPLVRVKYYIPNAHRTTSCISSKCDFSRMGDVHHMLKNNVVDMLIKEVNEVIEELQGTYRPLMLS